MDKRRKNPFEESRRDKPADRLESVRHVRVQKENEDSCAQLVRDMEKVGLNTCWDDVMPFLMLINKGYILWFGFSMNKILSQGRATLHVFNMDKIGNLSLP